MNREVLFAPNIQKKGRFLMKTGSFHKNIQKHDLAVDLP